jgi:hypothetical protein
MRNLLWNPDTRIKLKLTLGLLMLAIALLVANKYEKDRVDSIDASYVSIYEDRLVPATCIFEIQENLYRKQELLQRLLESNEDGTFAAFAGIASCNQDIDRLLVSYKKTYFLEEETQHLQAFENELALYNQEEERLLKALKAGELPPGSAASHASQFKKVALELSALNHIQSEIGKTMVADSKRDKAWFNALSLLEYALILVFGLLGYVLLFVPRAPKVIKHRVEPFNIN